MKRLLACAIAVLVVAACSDTGNGDAVPEIARISPAELLQAEDLPTAVNWQVNPGPHGWYLEPGTSEGIRMHLCPDGQAGEDLWDFALLPPLSDLQDHAIIGFTGASIALTQIVYTDSEEAISSAFNQVSDQIRACVDSPDRWRYINPEFIAMGYGYDVEHLADPGHDNVLAIQYTLTDPGEDIWLDHRLAVVKLGSRLTVIEQDGWQNASSRLSDADFAAIIDEAQHRIDKYPTARDRQQPSRPQNHAIVRRCAEC